MQNDKEKRRNKERVVEEERRKNNNLPNFDQSPVEFLKSKIMKNVGNMAKSIKQRRESLV